VHGAPPENDNQQEGGRRSTETPGTILTNSYGSGTETRSHAPGTTTRARTPGVGTFIAYINGGFSTDFAFNATFPRATATTVLGNVTVTDSEAHSYTGNVNYKFDIPNGWWLEPTAGLSYSETFFDGPLAVRGETLLVQGGARIGTEVMWNGVRVQPTFTGLAYSNVLVRVGGIAPVAGAPTDEGQLWVKGAAKLNFLFTDHFSGWVEGNVRGTSGTVDAIGAGVQVGARMTF
jgi:Autotransporter beta-domain